MSWKHRGFTPSVHSDSLLPLCFASITGCSDQTHQIIIKEGLPPKDVFQKWTEVDLLQKKPKQSVSECQHLSGDHTGTKKLIYTVNLFNTLSQEKHHIRREEMDCSPKQRERERENDSSHFKTFFTCEAVVSNPLCLTIFHLH